MTVGRVQRTLEIPSFKYFTESDSGTLYIVKCPSMQATKVDSGRKLLKDYITVQVEDNLYGLRQNSAKKLWV